MLTIKVFLEESGRIATLKKDFPLYQGQFQDKLLDVYVPTSILAPQFTLDSYIGIVSGSSDPSPSTLDGKVLEVKGRQPQSGDAIFSVNTSATTYTYKKWTYTTTWTGVSVDYLGFASPYNASVKIGCISKKANGEQYKSTSKSMRFIKFVTINNVDYALYERKLPKEFTTYYGASTQAPTMVINVVNVDSSSDIISLVTSQTCLFEVLPSAIVDNDATIDASDLDLINATLNSHSASITELDNDVDDLKSRMTTAEGDIDSNTSAIASNSNRISALEQGETYIGKIVLGVGDTFPPSDATLDAFVLAHTSPSRASKIGDTIIVEKTTSTSGVLSTTTYKFVKHQPQVGETTNWDYYEITTTTKAENGSFGIIQGTVGVASQSSNNVLLDIDDGNVKDIKVSGKTIKTNLDVVDNIMGGTTVVPKATSDASGNTITSTYQTKVEGATKTYVTDYALPKEFNIAHWISSDGTTFTDTAPASGSTFNVVLPTSIGRTTLFEATYSIPSGLNYQLSNKNGYSTSTYFTSTIKKQDCAFVLTTYIKLNDESEWVSVNAERIDDFKFKNIGQVMDLKFGNEFSNIADVLNMVGGSSKIKQKLEIESKDSNGGTITILANTTNGSTRFYVNTNSCSLKLSSGQTGEVNVLDISGFNFETGNVICYVKNTAFVENGLYIADFSSNFLEDYLDDYFIIRREGTSENIVVKSLGTTEDEWTKVKDLTKFSDDKAGSMRKYYRIMLLYNGTKFIIYGFNINKIISGSTYINVELDENDEKLVVELDQTNIETQGATEDSSKLITSGAVFDDLATKQDELVSGTNIKTINSQSILGSGNLNVSGLPSGGTQGQSLVKASGTDYDATWSSLVAGGVYDAQNELIEFEGVDSLQPLTASDSDYTSYMEA